MKALIMSTQGRHAEA